MENSQKIQAFIAHHGIASRRKAEQMVAEGKVKVNGVQAHVGQRITAKDQVLIDDIPINTTEVEKIYIILNKPRNIVSTTSDELGRKTVLDLIPDVKEQVYPVGRLDMDSEGLIILTNDGELAYTMTHPKFEIEKTYHVLLKGIPSTRALEHLRKGIRLKERFVKPVKIEIVKRENGNTWLSITIREGLNHQVRRMIQRTGYDVLRLVRISMGNVSLGSLKVGEHKVLSKILL